MSQGCGVRRGWPLLGLDGSSGQVEREGARPPVSFDPVEALRLAVRIRLTERVGRGRRVNSVYTDDSSAPFREVAAVARGEAGRFSLTGFEGSGEPLL